MPVTPKMIVADLRSELALNVPDQRAIGRMVADALELIDARIDNAERQPEAVDVRHGEAGEIRGRRKK
jgi:hypothetical protein